MSKFIARLVVGLALLYGGGATAFAFLNYGEAPKPDVPTILSDFNDWLASFVRGKPNPNKPAAPSAPGSTPAGATDPAAPPAPSPEPEPATPGPAPAPAPTPPQGMSAEGKELWHIQNEVLPRAAEKARALRDMSRADAPAFESARTDVMAMLGDARTFLNEILEREPDHQQANRLWNKLQEIYGAVKKL